MMGIGPIIMGTTAAAGNSRKEVTQVPIPRFVDGKWWSLTPRTKGTDPKYGIVTHSSSDDGATWTEHNVTYTSTRTYQDLDSYAYGNGLMAGIIGSDALWKKSLSNPSLDMVFIPGPSFGTGGAVVFGLLRGLSYSEDTGLFTLLQVGVDAVDVYTSPDLVTFTLANPGNTTLFDLISNPFSINYNGSLYVCYGFGQTGDETIQSTDLATWTNATSSPELSEVLWFKGKYFTTRKISQQTVYIYTSPDLITWSAPTIFDGSGDSPPIQYRYDRAIVNNDQLVLICDVVAISTTDGITFTVTSLNTDLTSLKYETIQLSPPAIEVSKSYYIRGDLDVMNYNRIGAPSFLMRTLSTEESGGGIMKWSSGLDSLPVSVFPATPEYGDMQAGIGPGVESGQGYYDSGMGSNGNIASSPGSNIYTFYQFNSKNRYLEFTYVGNPVGSYFWIGLAGRINNQTDPSRTVKLYFGAGGSYSRNNDAFVPTSWVPAIGDVLSILLEWDTDTITFRANDVIVYTDSIIAKDRLWTPIWTTVAGSKVKINVGQEDFAYPFYINLGAVPWDDGIKNSGLTPIGQPRDTGSALWMFYEGERVQSPNTVIYSKKSTDSGDSWELDTTQYDTSFAVSTDLFGNNIIGGVSTSSTYSKDLGTDGNSWQTRDISSIPGGAVVGGINAVTFDWGNNVFILNKGEGADIYTSPDMLTWAPVNGVTVNTLNSILSASYIVNSSGTYVAYGTDSGAVSGYSTATSADLLTWTISAPLVERLENFAYFNGAFYGTYTEGVNNQTDTLAVYRSTDFVNWTKMVLPSVEAGSYAVAVVVNLSYYTIVSHSSVFYTSNGTTFIREEASFNLGVASSAVTGRTALLSNNATGSDYWYVPVGIEQYGGKILEWRNKSLTSAPSLRYPDSSPFGAVVGFLDSSTNPDTNKISNDGFTQEEESTSKYCFYLNKSDTRYFEGVVNLAQGAASIEAVIGIAVPSYANHAGLTLYEVQLINGFVKTNNGNLPVTYSYVDGDVIGVKVNFVLGTIEFLVNNISLTTVSNISAAVLWTQYISSTGCSVDLNIGQDSFVYDHSADSIAWASEYV